MHVTIALPARRLLTWHGWLVAAVAARAAGPVSVRLAETPPDEPPSSVALLLRLEALVGRHLADDALAPLSRDDAMIAPYAGIDSATADLVIAPDARAAPAGRRTLVPLFDGSPGETAMWQALLDGRAPVVAVDHGSGGPPVPMARPALENPTRLASAAAQVLSRTAEALAVAADDIAVRGIILARAPDAAVSGGDARRVVDAPGFLARTVAAKARQRLRRKLDTAPRWAVAYRQAARGRTAPGAPLDAASLRLLTDDGRRYFADPFLFPHDGRLHLFVEELPYATGRGIISASVLADDGRFTPPRPVLEQDFHLSYPQVFAEGGAIYMLPEASQSGSLDLYRAEPFPDRWVHAARILDGHYHDATLFRHEGRLWIAAGSVTRGSATWDGLALFHADTLTGPWRPHPLNPARVDARCARPAGDLFRSGGALWRPAQDCTTGYGGALTFNRIDRLDTAGFEETAVATLGLAGVAGPHTINWAAGIEVLDLFAPPTWTPDATGA